MAGHAVRWQGTGSDVDVQEPEKQKPFNFGESERLPGPSKNRIANNSAMRGV